MTGSKIHTTFLFNDIETALSLYTNGNEEVKGKKWKFLTWCT